MIYITYYKNLEEEGLHILGTKRMIEGHVPEGT